MLLWDECPGSGSLGFAVSICSVSIVVSFFKEALKSFPSTAVSLHAPSSDVQASSSSRLSPVLGADARVPLLRTTVTRFCRECACPLLCGDPAGHDADRLFVCLSAICVSSQVKPLCAFVHLLRENKYGMLCNAKSFQSCPTLCDPTISLP